MLAISSLRLFSYRLLQWLQKFSDRSVRSIALRLSKWWLYRSISYIEEDIVSVLVIRRSIGGVEVYMLRSSASEIRCNLQSIMLFSKNVNGVTMSDTETRQ